MRQQNPRDFEVTVEGVGRFVFGYRVMRDEFKIQAEYSRVLDGSPPTDWLHVLAGWVSTLKVLTVEAPEGWDIDQMDPLDDDEYAKISKVFEALRVKEVSFRGKPGTPGT